MKVNVELLLQVGTKLVPIVRDVAPYLKDLKEFFETRSIESDRAKMDEIIVDAARREAVSDAEVAADADGPVAGDPGPSDGD